jgi:hypothetical protein
MNRRRAPVFIIRAGALRKRLWHLSQGKPGVYFSAQRKPSGPDQASGTPITAHPRFKINNVADRFRGATQTGR